MPRKSIIFTVIAFCFIGLFLRLSYWQYQRSLEKEHVLASISKKTKMPYQNWPLLKKSNSELEYTKICIKGVFDNSKTIFHDNQSVSHKPGYKIYVPFHVLNDKKTLLVNRGFVTRTKDRAVLPKLNEIKGTQTICGMVLKAPKSIVLSEIDERSEVKWPKVLQKIDLNLISKHLDNEMFPYVLLLETPSQYVFEHHFEPIVMKPATHKGYALQWLLLALMVVIAIIFYHKKSSKGPKK